MNPSNIKLTYLELKSGCICKFHESCLRDTHANNCFVCISCKILVDSHLEKDIHAIP
jgi:hypothetical protein